MTDRPDLPSHGPSCRNEWVANWSRKKNTRVGWEGRVYGGGLGSANDGGRNRLSGLDVVLIRKHSCRRRSGLARWDYRRRMCAASLDSRVHAVAIYQSVHTPYTLKLNWPPWRRTLSARKLMMENIGWGKKNFEKDIVYWLQLTTQTRLNKMSDCFMLASDFIG